MLEDIAWNNFMKSIDSTKNEDISELYRKQFKAKEEFIFPNDRRFLGLVKRVQTDEKLRTHRKWDKDCKMFLLWVMIKFFEVRNKVQVEPAPEEWNELAQILSIDQHSLKARWITLINPKQKSQNWTDLEDDIIHDSMKQRLHKHIWTQIAVRIYELNICPCARTPKQVRERWINYLNPNLRKRDLWLMKEDLVILTNVLKKGKRWSYISKKLEGRTENQVKNRYKSLINKIWTDEEMDEMDAINIYIKRNQSATNSSKHGMIGKRGRHKAGKKQAKAEDQSQRITSDQDMEIENENYDQKDDKDEIKSYVSESFSPKKLQKKIKFEAKSKKNLEKSNQLSQEFDYDKFQVNMTTRSQRQINEGKNQDYHEKKMSMLTQKKPLPIQSNNGFTPIEKNQQIQFKDYQRNFSNYFSQLSQQTSNTEVKIDLLNQAIEGFRMQASPQFQSISLENSCLNYKSQGLFKNSDLQPIQNIEDNISPFKYKLNDDLGMFNQQKVYDPNCEQIQQLMNLYQRQMTKLLGSQPPSAVSLNNNYKFENQSTYPNFQDPTVPSFTQFQNFNSALLGSALQLDFSPFGQKSVHREVDFNKVEQFIKTEDQQYLISITPVKQTPTVFRSTDVFRTTDLDAKIKDDFLQGGDNPIEKYNKRRRNISQQIE